MHVGMRRGIFMHRQPENHAVHRANNKQTPAVFSSWTIKLIARSYFADRLLSLHFQFKPQDNEVTAGTSSHRSKCLPGGILYFLTAWLQCSVHCSMNHMQPQDYYCSVGPSRRIETGRCNYYCFTGQRWPPIVRPNSIHRATPGCWTL